ncbi:MAG: hypothetical protein IT542_12970 [Rubellimicrobium sp.]|nr:hypothetical protein [Rubellimicrobium sp.]
MAQPATALPGFHRAPAPARLPPDLVLDPEDGLPSGWWILPMALAGAALWAMLLALIL